MQAESTGSIKALEWLAWLEANVRKVLIGGAIVAAIAAVVFFYKYRADLQEAAAYDALLAVQAKAGRGIPNSADYRKVQTDFASTAAGRQAGLLAAAALFTEGKFEEAQAAFASFAGAGADDPLAPSAALGAAACLEARKDIEGALAAYQRVIGEFPNDGAAAQAKLAVGRIQEAKGRHADALKLYQDVTRSPQMTVWQSEFADRRDDLLRRFPQLAETNAAPAIPGTTPAPAAK